MSSYIEIDLDKEEKQALLKYANIFLDKETQADLENGRKKWIRFRQGDVSDIIGELSYHFNRCKSDYQFHLLDELIMRLESYE